MNTLDAEFLRSVLRYDKDTGLFYWIDARSCRKAGAQAGRLHHKGYIEIGLNGELWRAHRLAWMHVYGNWPKGQIDHIDCNRTNNRISNLRDTSHAGNQHNRWTAQKNNKAGLLGVTRLPYKSRPWLAQIMVNRKHIALGTYATPEEAHQAYIAAKEKLHDLPTKPLSPVP